MNIEMKVKSTRPQNFILVEGHEAQIPVGDLSREQAIEYANLIRDEFLEHWAMRSSQGRIE